MGHDHSHKKDPLVVRLLGWAFLLALPVLITLNFEAFKEVASRKFDLSVIDLIMIVVGTTFFFLFWRVFHSQIAQKYVQLFEERERATGGAMDGAKAMKEEAESLNKKFEAEIIKARQDAVREKLNKLDLSRQEASAKLGQAEDRASSLIAQTRNELVDAVAKVQSGLVKDVDVLASEIAERIKREPLSPG